MARVHAGELLPPFTYDTPFAKSVRIEDTLRRVRGKTALVFLRYYGCRMCQYDMRQFEEKYPLIAGTGGQLLVVLQSTPESLRRQTEPEELPYDLVCDPEQRLYRMLEISPAASRETLVDEKSAKKMEMIEKTELRHGDYEGNELQLPAVFIVTPRRELTYVRYGVSAGDVPTPEETAALLSDGQKGG